MKAVRRHHIQLKEGDIGRYVLLPGDPGRCEKIASFFNDPQLIATNREYKTYTGTLLGEKVSVISTGIGNPSTAIAIEELIALGADTFIRVGTSGGMQPYLKAGDLGIIWGAIRDEGTTRHYMPVEFPAVADLEVVTALQRAAKRLGYRCHTGISHSKDSFYGQHQPERMPIASHLIERWNTWRAGGAICAEMESATLFVLSSIYKKRAGSVLLIAINQTGDEPHVRAFDPTPAIHTAVEAVKILIKSDRQEQSLQNGRRKDFKNGIE